MHEVNTYVRQAIAQLRYVPSPVADPEAVALQAQVEAIVSDTVPEADIEWNLTEVSFSAKEQVELLACIREALLNVRKHAHATKVEVYTKGNASNWSVHIRDNGTGIQGDPMLFKDRYGLRITKERAEQMGWTFQLDSTPGNTQMIIGKGQT